MDMDTKVAINTNKPLGIKLATKEGTKIKPQALNLLLARSRNIFRVKLIADKEASD